MIKPQRKTCAEVKFLHNKAERISCEIGANGKSSNQVLIAKMLSFDESVKRFVCIILNRKLSEESIQIIKIANSL